MARFVAGRKVGGDGQLALSPSEIEQIAEARLRDGGKTVPQRSLGRDSGRFLYKASTNEPLRIEVSSALSPVKRDRGFARETERPMGQCPSRKAELIFLGGQEGRWKRKRRGGHLNGTCAD